ncbi:hypothetical protein [Fowlpox virus]|uniref:Uncharacterized protein n=2 Tax=Fowlpox virus TaxID=10261 RepID=Q9J530_FOWPN|nr:hypothetical protein FPV205 [Fowlpox virus]UNS14435.1 ALPV-271 [Albatrosspox virus]CAE52743.1 hypothetical protein [Fowlpox virus isolate HP-438/Munich]AAF44549.1 ORF FPV205 hypothetical protein [Fowlpox virus]ART91638.1 hypothetical protein [Fowlpox virus]AXY04647.1 hypothetical protein [Fowlpox virus]
MNRVIRILVILSNVVHVYPCKRSVSIEQSEANIILCPSTSIKCVKWMYVEKKEPKSQIYKTLGIMVFPDSYHIKEPNYLSNLTLDKITLKRWSTGDVYHVSIGIKKKCMGSVIESIFVDDSYITRRDNYNSTELYNNTTNIVLVHFLNNYQLYTLVLSSICVVIIIIIVCYISYKHKYINKKIKTISNSEKFILINVHPDREPLITHIDESEYESDDN